MGRSRHTKKEVEEALRYAEENGWQVLERHGRGHAWGQLYCPFNDEACRCGAFCRVSIWSTPKSPGNHARQIRQVVDNCSPQRLLKVQEALKTYGEE